MNYFWNDYLWNQYFWNEDLWSEYYGESVSSYVSNGFNRVMLKQERKGIKRLINESPVYLTLYRKPLVSDGMGGFVEDPYSESVQHEIKCRIDHEKKFPGNTNLAGVGFSTSLSRFILVDWGTEIYENDTLEEIGKGFKIGAIDPIKKYGGVVAYQAPLIEAELSEVTS